MICEKYISIFLTLSSRGDGRFHVKECECRDFKLEACLGISNGDGTSVCVGCGQTVISGIEKFNDDEEDEELV